MLDSKLIMQLRAQTGAGVLDAKKALEETNGDLNQAAELLRKKGVLKAAAKAERVASEGAISLDQQDNKIALVKLACETDFVARNSDFLAVAQEFAQKLLQMGENDFKFWAEEKIKNELIIKIGENIQLVDFALIQGAVLGSYLHSNKKIAAVVVLSGGTLELANDLAMQVAAMSPMYISPENVPAEELEKEKNIYREQLRNEGKPENIWDKILEGKLNKFYEDVCLTKQVFVKDETLKIEKMLSQAGAKVEKMARYSL